MMLVNDLNSLNKHMRTALLAWLVVAILFYLLAAINAGTMLTHNKQNSEQRHADRLSDTHVESGKTTFDPALLLTDEQAEKVEAGIYLDRITELSTKNTYWIADFYLWFRWKDTDLDPGQTFHIVGGDIISKTTAIERQETPQGLYSLYRIKAKITKYFDTMRYPLNNHLLTLHIEERSQPWKQLQYVADTQSSAYSSRIHLSGYEPENNSMILVKPHAYRTDRGNPLAQSDADRTFSQLIFGLYIKRPDWLLYFKVFQGLFASIAVAFVAFALPPSFPGRLPLGIGAFFASVASSYVNTNQLPGTHIATLTDIMNGLAMFTIFLSIWVSAILNRMTENTDHPCYEQRLVVAKHFNITALLVLASGFILCSIIFAISAHH